MTASLIQTVKLDYVPEITLAQLVKAPASSRSYIKTYDAVIIGAGPAGAYCGYCLSKQGIYPVILDHSHPREKPCGGMVSNRAFNKFPLLKTLPDNFNMKNSLEVVSSSGQKVTLEQDCGHGVSRRLLDRHLLDHAIHAGCRFIPEKVLHIKNERGLWIIKTSQRELRARVLIGADGTRSIVRKSVLQPFDHDNLAMGIGYLAAEEKSAPSQLKILNDRKGYFWKVNRGNYSSIGILDSIYNAPYLKKDLNTFLNNYFKDAHLFSRWSALVPRITTTNFYSNPCAGKNWLLIGDAAGHVNSLTGEGIIYALWSAELASQAIAVGDLRLFDSLWRDEYAKELVDAVIAQKILYNRSAMDTAIWFSTKSKRLLNIVYNLLSGELPVKKAWLKTLYNLPMIGLETILRA